MDNKGFSIELYNSQNATQTFIADITRLCKNVSATIRLNNVSDLSFSIEIESWKEFCEDSGIDAATAFKPLASEIKVKYNDIYLPHAFEVQTAPKSYGLDSKVLTINARDTAIKLSRRVTFQSFSAVDSAKITRDMITYTQAKTYGNFGITFGNTYLTGVATDRKEWTATSKVILDAIKELSDDVSGGFDFYFDHDWKYYTMATRGSIKDKPFVYGGDTSNVISMEVPDDGTIIANAVYVVGNGIGNPVISDPNTDTTSAITYRLSEKTLSYSDAALARANQISQREVRDRKDGYYLPKITVSQEELDPTTIYVGDTIPFQCNDLLSPFTGNGRIKELGISLDDNFYATFTLELLRA
jgi:hypothetical protein